LVDLGDVKFIDLPFKSADPVFPVTRITKKAVPEVSFDGCCI
jgi:hypothetical protein